MAGSHQEDSLGWRLQQSQQRFSEWLERTLSGQRRPGDPFQLPDWSLPEVWIKLIFWGIAIGLVIWLGWQLYRLLRPYLDDVLTEPGLDLARADETETVLSVAQWLERSRLAAQAGNYRDACRALYMAALQRLDDTKRIPNERSRTDGEYLTLLQKLPRRHPYEFLIQTHERLWFGNSKSSAQEFDRCQRAYREIDTP